MNLDEFKESLQNESPPELKDELKALWYDAKDEWDNAHKIVQKINSREAARVHAYLHRKEGDKGNAGYWYHRADKEFCYKSLKDEWNEIVSELLNK